MVFSMKFDSFVVSTHRVWLYPHLHSWAMRTAHVYGALSARLGAKCCACLFLPNPCYSPVGRYYPPHFPDENLKAGEVKYNLTKESYHLSRGSRIGTQVGFISNIPDF